jgi:hypothetical protein
MDTEIFSKTVYLSRLSESENLFLQEDLKLFTIGFIWSLIEHSMEFDFSKNDGNGSIIILKTEKCRILL